MTKAKTEMVLLSRIVNKFDVRIALDEDRVLQFVGMYQSDIQLPPVALVALDDDRYAYIDGRHRGAARAYLNFPNIEAVIHNGSLSKDSIELFARALESNWGHGPKPPTRNDITHTIIRMIEHGASQTACRERLSFLPPGSARAYIADAMGTITKRKVINAMDAVADGSTLPDAAKKFGLKPEKLRDAIQGKKSTWGTNRSTEVQTATNLKAYISTSLRSANTGIAKKMQEVLRLVEDGDMSAKVAHGILDSWSDHLRKTSLRLSDWESRLAAIEESHLNPAEIREAN